MPRLKVGVRYLTSVTNIAKIIVLKQGRRGIFSSERVILDLARPHLGEVTQAHVGVS